MAVTIARTGFGYVEPNHLSAPRNGQVYAQLPAAEDIEVLENGMFVKYDYAAGECNFDGEGPWIMTSVTRCIATTLCRRLTSMMAL